MDFSIIIPSYNRKDVLVRCLDAISRQSYDLSLIEVIIVDDGSSDGTGDCIKKYSQNSSLNIRYFFQENRGQGHARNLGIEKAEGDIILFIGDDMIASPDLLEEHAKFHKINPAENEAVLGYVEWHPDLQITPFMRWLTDGSNVLGKFGGHQFAFEKLTGGQAADYNFFYTSNISLKRTLLLKDKFDNHFSFYGWEDIELGYRLQKKHGLKLYYNSNAIVYHLHAIDLDSFKKRMELIGKSIHLLDELHPELKKSPRLLKRLIFRLLGAYPTILLFKALKRPVGGMFFNLYHYAISKRAFLKGFYSFHSHSDRKD